MRVLHITAYPPTHLGGLEIYVKKISFYLRKNGIQSDIVTTDTFDNRPRIEHMQGSKIYYLRNYGELWGKNPVVNLIPFLWRHLTHYDLIHVHSYLHLTTIQAILLCKLFHKPIILTLHGGVQTESIEGATLYENLQIYFKKYFFDKLPGKLIIDNCTALTSVSKSDLLAINRVFHSNRRKANYWISNSIDSNYTLLPNKVNRRGLLFVGRLSTIKGFDQFLKIAYLVNQMHPGIPIWIIGTGALLYLLPRYSLNIHYKPRVSNELIGKYYKNAAIFVLSSRFEGLPTTILEALKFGTPIVASQVGGVTDVLKNEYNAFLYPSGDHQTAAQEIDKLLTDSELNKQITQNGLNTISTQLSWEINIKKFIILYKKLAEHP